MRLVLAAAAIAVCSPAFAQDGAVVTGQPLVDAITQYAIAVTAAMIPVLLTIFTAWLKKKFDLQNDAKFAEIEARFRDTVQTSLTNAAGAMVQKLGVEAGKMTVFKVGNSDVAEAIDMVIRGAGDAVDHFAMSPEDIAERLQAKVGLLVGVTDDDGMPVTQGAVPANVVADST